MKTDITVKLIDSEGKLVESREFEDDHRVGLRDEYIAYVENLRLHTAPRIHNLSGNYQINIEFNLK